ncbi:MAG: hypothetical protein RLZZ496_805 [Pseudomonadota bacterium]
MSTRSQLIMNGGKISYRLERGVKASASKDSIWLKHFEALSIYDLEYAYKNNVMRLIRWRNRLCFIR